MVSVLGSYYYDDGCEPCGNDTFSREPFIVKFSSPTTREQSPPWGMPRPGTGSPPCRAEPRAVPAKHRGVAILHQGPTHGCPGLLWPCPAWPATPAVPHHVPSPTNHLSSPTMNSLQLCAMSHLQLLPTVSYIPLCATSHLVPYPITCFFWLGAISHHVPSPITCHPPSLVSHIMSHFPLCSTAYPMPSPSPPENFLRAYTLSHLLPKTILACKC